MDCLGKEVTHKMKSAIMAKLMELGIKADLDLLEYIMLMISNKRSKAGMNRDLSLFLGSSTVPFVTWLHQVLSKLQEVTISTQVSQPKTKKTDNVPSEKLHENPEAKLLDNLKCKKRERTPSGDDQDYLNIRADTEADPIDDLQSVIDESAAKSSLPSTYPTEEKEPDRVISTKQVSSKTKDSQSSKTSSSLEKQKSVEEQSKDDGVTKRKKISPPAKEREKESLKDECDPKKRRVSPPPSKGKGKEKESSRDDSELRRKRFSSPIEKEREKELSKGDNEIKRKRMSSPIKDKDRETLKDDGEFRRKRLTSPSKEKELLTDDVDLRRKRLTSPAREKESLRDDGAVRRRRLSPEKDYRVKDADKRSGSESGRRDKPVYDVRELLNKRKAEKSAVPDEKQSRETERRRKSPPSTRRPVSERDRDRERMRERVRERENQKRSSSRELSSDRRRPPSKVVRVESSVHDVSEARSGRSNFTDRDRTRKASSSGGESTRDSDREREREATVPSVVKVTPRPVRPPNQQPSSSLILKAMAEANKSLAKQGATKTASTVMNRKTDTVLRGRISPEKITITLTNNRVQPLTKEDKENKLYVPSNGRDESYERLKQSRAMMKRSVIEDAKRKDTETEMSNSGKVERTRLAANETKKAKRTVDEEREMEDDDDDEVELDIGVDPHLGYECELEEDRMEIKERKPSETNSSPRSRSLSYGSDNGKANDEVNKWLGTGNVQDGHNDSKLSQETDSEPVLEICPNSVELDVDEPEFVVTLNGLNSTMYSCLSDDDEDLLNQSSRYDHNFNEESEKRNRSANIVIEPEEPSKQDKSQSEAVDNTQTSIPKSLDRCRYWPNCLAGDKCSYFHPTTMCKMFPSCKYGDHCLFIHPPCKFGVACTRRDCAYRHPSKPPLAAKASVSVMTSSSANTNCRFFPNCTNPACPFFHPKPCRFGTYCTKKNCAFDHTVRLSQNKLKWIRQE